MHTTHRPTAPRTTPQPPAAPLSLDERLALINTAMAARLDEAAVAYEVNTAHIPTAPLALTDVVTVPLTPRLAPEPSRTPVAGLLHRTLHLLESDGWCSGAYSTPEGAHCLLGALRAQASGDHRLEQRAIDVLMDAIRGAFGPDVDTIPAFNDAWADARTPLRILGIAARRADARGL
ncbi:hypothetical protein ABT127_29465 [Streptomyces sp. NPDC001904]|uniref:DUF6197 family protein n=1 Tax=Streptomyces sp. NPDC001904 TaxID=3154531 RepID=UPI00332C4E91